MSNKIGEKYIWLLTEFNLHRKGVQENNKLWKSASKKRKERKTYKRVQLEKKMGYVKSFSSQKSWSQTMKLIYSLLKGRNLYPHH